MLTVITSPQLHVVCVLAKSAACSSEEMDETLIELIITQPTNALIVCHLF